MKLITRTNERNMMRKHNEPAYAGWTAWEVCEGTEGMNETDCRMCIREWSNPSNREWLNESKTYARVNDAYCREEFRIVGDNHVQA